MNLEASAKIVVDNDLINMISDLDGTSEEVGCTLVDFLLYAKQERNVATETTSVVWEKTLENWPAGIVEYLDNIISPSDIDFHQDGIKSSVSELAKASSQVEEVYLISEKDYSELEDENSILLWTPEEFYQFASEHSGFKEYLSSLD